MSGHRVVVKVEPGYENAEEHSPAFYSKQIGLLRGDIGHPVALPPVLSKDTMLSAGFEDVLHRAPTTKANFCLTGPLIEMDTGVTYEADDQAGASAPPSNRAFWNVEAPLAQPASPRLLPSQSLNLMDEIAIPSAMQSLDMNTDMQIHSSATGTVDKGKAPMTMPIDIPRNIAAGNGGTPLAELSNTEVLSHLAMSTRRINIMRVPALISRAYDDNWLDTMVSSPAELEAMEILAGAPRRATVSGIGGYFGHSRHGFSDDADAEYSINSGNHTDSDDDIVRRERLSPESARQSWRIPTTMADYPIPSVEEVYASPEDVPGPVEMVFPGPTADMRHQQMLRIQRPLQPQNPSLRQAREQPTNSPLRTSFSAYGDDEETFGPSSSDSAWTPSSSPLFVADGGATEAAHGHSPVESIRQSARHARRRDTAPYPVDGHPARQECDAGKKKKRAPSGALAFLANLVRSSIQASRRGARSKSNRKNHGKSHSKSHSESDRKSHKSHSKDHSKSHSKSHRKNTKERQKKH